MVWLSPRSFSSCSSSSKRTFDISLMMAISTTWIHSNKSFRLGIKSKIFKLSRNQDWNKEWLTHKIKQAENLVVQSIKPEIEAYLEKINKRHSRLFDTFLVPLVWKKSWVLKPMWKSIFFTAINIKWRHYDDVIMMTKEKSEKRTSTGVRDLDFFSRTNGTKNVSKNLYWRLYHFLLDLPFRTIIAQMR